MIISCAPRRCSALFLPPGICSLQKKTGKEIEGTNPPLRFHCHPRTQYTFSGILVNMKKAHIFSLLPSKTQNSPAGQTLLPKLRREILAILLKISYTVPVYPVPGRVSPCGVLPVSRCTFTTYPCGTRGSRIYIKITCGFRYAAPGQQLLPRRLFLSPPELSDFIFNRISSEPRSQESPGHI